MNTPVPGPSFSGCACTELPDSVRAPYINQNPQTSTDRFASLRDASRTEKA